MGWRSEASGYECDHSKLARQAVKSLIAAEDIKGVKDILGGLVDFNPEFIKYKIALKFQSDYDVYEVVIRTKDCRITNVSLTSENL